MSINKGALKAFICGAGVAFFHMAITAYFSQKKEKTDLEEAEEKIYDHYVAAGRPNPEPIIPEVFDSLNQIRETGTIPNVIVDEIEKSFEGAPYVIIDGDQVGEEEREVVTLYYYTWDDVLMENDEEEVSDLLLPLKEFIAAKMREPEQTGSLVYHVRHPALHIDYEVIPLSQSWHDLFAGGEK